MSGISVTNMAKEKTVYVCTNCGQESPKWAGKCPSCGQWNTFVEEVVRKEAPVAKHVAHGIESVRSKPQPLKDIASDEEQRIDMGDEELNRVLGGGLVQGSLTLIGGEPGIGKSTLVLQTVLRRECTASLLKFAKETGTPVILIGHINKEGSIAGPKVLEHIVDTVLQFEGDQHYMYRILRSIKNRFGSTAELGIYEMRQDGLRQVSNPSELLLTQDHEGMSGVAIAGAVEGVRPFLIEVQALVSTAAYGMPQRSATGFDLRRMNMLLAVLEKRVGFKLAQKDVFLNIAGGLKVNDPAIDLAVISAILSSNMDSEIETGVCMAGEVGLSGEIRPVNRIEQRISEAEKLGFQRMLIPKHNLSGIDRKKIKIELVPVRKVEEAFRELFG